MKTTKVTEKFDDNGRLIERVTETTESFEMAPTSPVPQYNTFVQAPPSIFIHPNTFPRTEITCAADGRMTPYFQQ